MSAIQKDGKSVPGSERIRAAFMEIAGNFQALMAQADVLALVADDIIASIRTGGKVMFCGNGGSAADAQHLAAELMGRYLVDRAPLPALALTVDTSALTAIGNDYSFDEVFSRQVMGVGRAGDVLIGFSTSGNSRNVLAAFEAARARSIHTIGFTGQAGGKIHDLCDRCVMVPSSETARIQEMHIAAGHMICELVESAFV